MTYPTKVLHHEARRAFSADLPMPVNLFLADRTSVVDSEGNGDQHAYKGNPLRRSHHVSPEPVALGRNSRYSQNPQNARSSPTPSER